MIDIKLIRESPELIEAELASRGIKLRLGGKTVPFSKLTELDQWRCTSQAKLDELRSKQKAIKDAKHGRKLKEQIKAETDVHKAAEAEFHELYMQLPNFHHQTVPEGPDETGNKVVRQIGDKQIPAKGRDNSWVKPHYEIPAIAPLIDIKRGAKVSGNRFWYLKGPLVHLEFALIRYALDFYTKKGYLPMRSPSIVRYEAMEGTGFFPADSSEIYELEDEEGKGKSATKYLVGTAEVSLAAYHMNETLDDLPRYYSGFSPAYRREAGAYGQDTKGILRGHEFDKLELFVFAHPDKSWDEHERMQAESEEFWRTLGIPFQTVNMCTGDIAAPNAKKYDIEAWMPGEGKYREITSNSNDTDFQARRLRIKHKGKFVHTLNNTACAVGRTIIAICENYQDESGNVDMPKVLHPYLPFTRIEKGS